MLTDNKEVACQHVSRFISSRLSSQEDATALQNTLFEIVTNKVQEGDEDDEPLGLPDTPAKMAVDEDLPETPYVPGIMDETPAASKKRKRDEPSSPSNFTKKSKSNAK